MFDLEPLHESNVHIARSKRLATLNWDLRSVRCLEAVVDLCIDMIALGRDAETVRIVAAVAEEARFDGNHNIWTPTQSILCAGAYAARRLGQDAVSDDFFSKAEPHSNHILGPAFGTTAALRSDLAIESSIDGKLLFVRDDLVLKFCTYEAGIRGFPIGDSSWSSTLSEIHQHLMFLRELISATD